jgi:hypothetical protein
VGFSCFIQVNAKRNKMGIYLHNKATKLTNIITLKTAPEIVAGDFTRA